MSLKARCASFTLALFMVAGPLWALAAERPAAGRTADEPGVPTKIFKLQRGTSSVADELDLEEEAVARWEPGIEGGSVETTLTLGFMNLSSTLLKHDQMIYKYTTESTYWGDVEIVGETAFNPSLRLGYNLTPWMCLEGYGGISISEYQARVTNRWSRKNETPPPPPRPDPVLGEFDEERRSLITLQTGVNGMLYPFNLSGEGQGRWHPFVSAGVGRIWYDMNSNFTDGSAGSMDYALGAGLRLLADRNVSIRLDAMFHVNSVEFTPAAYFDELDEGTTRVPLNEYPRDTDESFVERPVSAFDAQDVNYLAWSIGVHGSF